MKIQSIAKNSYNLNFGDALSTTQEKKYAKLMKEVDEVQGRENGKRLIKLYPYALPSNEATDCGIGKINSPEAKRFYEIAKYYGGATAIKLMPLGQLTDKPVYSENKYPGAYNRSAMAFGEDIIDIAQLSEKQFGCILSKQEVEKFVNKHKAKHNHQDTVDFGTTLGWENQENYPVNELLRSAFYNFNDKNNDSCELNELRKEFNAFKNQHEPIDYDDIYTRLALFPYLKDWATARTDFFVGFDSDPEIRAKKMPEYNRLKSKYKNEIEFYKFKQFLAKKTLQQAKTMVNGLGMDLVGDCILGFSWPEVQSFPDAFLKDEYGRNGECGNWGIPALDYDKLISDGDNASKKLLDAKVGLYLDNFDGIRFDVGWSYINPAFHFGDNNLLHMNAGNAITNHIESLAKKIKGDKFDLKNLFYECDADGKDFNLWQNAQTIKNLGGMAILSTEHEHNDPANIGWGSISFLKENMKFGDDDFILGTNTHDGRGVLSCAKDSEKSAEQVGALMRVFKLRPEDGCEDGWRQFKDNGDINRHLHKYIRGRFAEVELAKNSFIQYNDFLGRPDKVDYHTNGKGHHGDIDYKCRLERNYEENYHKGLQDNVGYNQAEAKQFIMERFGLDKKYPELYEKVKKYALYLKHKGGIYTKEQANKSQQGKLDIEKLSLSSDGKLDISA